MKYDFKGSIDFLNPIQGTPYREAKYLITSHVHSGEGHCQGIHWYKWNEAHVNREWYILSKENFYFAVITIFLASFPLLNKGYILI